MSGFQAFKIGAQSKRPAPRPSFGEEEDEPEAMDIVGQRHEQPASGTAAQEQESGDRAAAAGQYGRAMQHWDAALASSPANAYQLHESKAQVWLEVGEDWKAVQCATRAVQLRPGWPAGHLTLARAQFNLGEPELALASMEAVLQLEPGHPEAAVEIGEIRAVVARRQQAGSAAAGQRATVLRPGEGPAAAGGAANDRGPPL